MSNRLLYFGPSGIGDWCFIYPSLPRLLAACECDNAVVVVPYRNAGNELLRDNPLISELYYLDRGTGIRFPAYCLRWWNLLRRVRRSRFKVLVMSYLSNQPDFLLLARFSGIPVRIGRRTEGEWLHGAFTHPLSIPSRGGKVAIHAAYTEAIASDAVAVDTPPLFDESLFADHQKVLDQFGLKRPLIVLGVGGGREARWRFWPAGHYRQVISEHPRLNFTLLGGGADDREQAHQIIHGGLPNVTDLVNQTTMRQALKILRGSDAVIANDSGIANISATLGVPTICLYGPTDPALTGPALIGAEALHVNIPCSPCFDDRQDPRIAKSCLHHRCMTELTPAMVTAQLKAMLGQQ